MPDPTTTYTDSSGNTIEIYTDISGYLEAIDGERDISNYILQLPSAIYDAAAIVTDQLMQEKLDQMWQEVSISLARITPSPPE
jgi:hypothetical protein